MIAISSYRPFGKFPDIDRNQIIAKHSWESVFDGTVYLNPFNVQLWSQMTQFTSTMKRPRMSELFITAVLVGGIAVVLNSDIVVGYETKTIVERSLRSGNACAFSFRHEFDPVRMNLDQARQIDSGLDFFVAHSAVWYKTFSACPERFVIGNAEWDSWLLEYWQRKYGRFCVNLTSHRIVFHPNHGNREREPDAIMA